MKKVLFIIKSFPARQSANVLCDTKIINELQLQDVEIHCLVSQFYDEKKEETIGKIHVHRMNKGLYWKLYTRARSEDRKASVIILKLDRLIMRIKQIVTVPFYPCYEPVNVIKLTLNAIRLHKKYKFDMVVSEYHGLESLHAGSILKKRYPSIVFIPILWDAFTGKQPAKYLPVKYSNWRMKKAEAYELACADTIIAMESSRKYHEYHSIQKSYYNKIIYLDIPGIIPPPKVSDCSKMLIKKDKINIVYAGVLSLPDRDPEYIIKTLSGVTNASDFHFIFICAEDGKQKLEAEKNNYSCSITVSGYIEKKELNKLFHEADVLLNLGGSNPNMVPSKVFEYLSYGKPILSTYYIDNEASLGYLKHYPLAVCIDQRGTMKESKKKIEDELIPIIGKRVPFETVKRLFPTNTPDQYIELIKKYLQ